MGSLIRQDRVGSSDDAVREAPQPTTSGKQKNDVLTPAMRKGRRAWAASPSAPSRSTMEAAPAPGLLVMDKSPAESGALHTHELT